MTEDTHPRRRRAITALAFAAVFTALLAGGGPLSCHASGAMASSSVSNAPIAAASPAPGEGDAAPTPGPSLPTRDAVVLFRGDDSFARAIAARVADEVVAVTAGLDRADVRAVQAPFLPAAGERLPDLIVCVEVLDDTTSRNPLRSKRTVSIAITGARSPGFVATRRSSPLLGARVAVLSEAWADVMPGLFRSPPDEHFVDSIGEHARHRFATLDVRPGPPPSTASGPPLETEPPIDLGPAAELIYLGPRNDGSSEARWQFDTQGSHAASIERIVAAARAGGWEKVGGTVFRDRRPCQVVLERGSDEIHLTYAYTPGMTHPEPGDPGRLAVTLRRAP